jgi:hypothetical protein
MGRKSQTTDLERWLKKTTLHFETETTECAVTALESGLSRIDRLPATSTFMANCTYSYSGIETVPSNANLQIEDLYLIGVITMK